MKADRATCHYMNQRWPIFLRYFPTDYLWKYGPINNKTALFDMMAWCRSGDRPSSGSVMAISLVTHTVAGLGTISWQCDRPWYDVTYVELITACCCHWWRQQFRKDQLLSFAILAPGHQGSHLKCYVILWWLFVLWVSGLCVASFVR